MARFDFGSIKKGVQKSAENLKKTVEDNSGNLPSSVKNVVNSESVKDIAKKGQSVFNTLKSKTEDTLMARSGKTAATKEQVSAALEESEHGEMVIGIPAALRIFYSMMAIDGTISLEEEEKFCEIARELDPNFESYKGQLIQECTQVVETPFSSEEEYYDNIHDYVGDIIRDSGMKAESGIRGKVLVWDLLAIAYSEGEYSVNEKRLLRYITKKLGVDDVVLLEMENTIRTLLAIEQEEEWLKTSNRSYREVEDRINELSDRKAVIMTGARALLND